MFPINLRTFPTIKEDFRRSPRDGITDTKNMEDSKGIICALQLSVSELFDPWGSLDENDVTELNSSELYFFEYQTF